MPAGVELTMPDGSVFPEKKSGTDEQFAEIVGLTAEQFTQIVMIAQGDFKSFLYKVGGAQADFFPSCSAQRNIAGYRRR